MPGGSSAFKPISQVPQSSESDSKLNPGTTAVEKQHQPLGTVVQTVTNNQENFLNKTSQEGRNAEVSAV